MRKLIIVIILFFCISEDFAGVWYGKDGKIFGRDEVRQEGMTCPHIPLTLPWYAVFQSFSTGGLLAGILTVLCCICIQPEHPNWIRIGGVVLLFGYMVFLGVIDYNEKDLLASYKKRCPKEGRAYEIYQNEMDTDHPTLQNIIYNLEQEGYSYDSLMEINGSEADISFCGCK